MKQPNSEKTVLKSLGGLSISSSAFLLPEIRSESGSQRMVVVCQNEDAAEKYYRDLEFFSRFAPKDWANISIYFLPGWEQSPYRNLQPGITNRLERVRVCSEIFRPDSNRSWIVVASLPSFLQATADRKHLETSLSLKKNDKVPPEKVCDILTKLGYQRAESVEDPASFSLRGGILDVFPPSQDHPIRIEFFDELVESIRVFNPESQRSIRIFSDHETVSLIPAREFACDLENLQQSRERLKDWCDHNDLPRTARERISSLLGQGIVTPEMDYLIPFFREKPSFLTDIVGKPTSLIFSEPDLISKKHEEWWGREHELFENSISRQQPIPNPELLYQPMEAAVSQQIWSERIELRGLAMGEEVPRFESIRLSSKKKSADIDGLEKAIRKFTVLGSHSVIVANSQSQLDRVQFILSQQKVRSIFVKSLEDLPKDPSIVALALGTISESFHFPEKKIAFFSEDEIFGEKQHVSRAKKQSSAPMVSMEDLVVGDFVVHAEHGIGKYLGLSRVNALNSEGDFVLVEYADGDRLYVPVYRLESLTRYVGTSGGTASLDKLGSGSFAKTKAKVKTAVKDIAQDLLRVQAERATKEGYAFSAPDEEYQRFEAEFPFDETPDQLKAIQDALHDMQTPHPMDRLVCGDVGFGKTEVAIRAAFKAAQDGKQVAVLVPTTILAEQHYLSFSNRMASYPIRLASISRFKSKKEQAAVLKDLEEGKLDIVIGTHRILSKDVKFKDLGLLIIDEEQRFGVEHKEKLKQLKATTDVLTLTATPIPRTLQMSLMGLKDVSIIRTPPGDRLSIKTYLASFDEELIANAIRTELGRGGQVFFIHNRVQTIGKIEEMVKKVVPEAKTVVAHGQMPESQLERAMIGFYQKQFDVLIATSIIENGLDVPNANTLIVNRADAFGLAQLYQIRGRVGRSQTRAYAYFLVPETAVITEDARERLSVLQRFVELGSGYIIATHDLEIRGGGDVLGQQQSGHIASVGYEMYLEMLQDEIHRLKGEAVKEPLEEVEINLPFSAVLPQEYVPDMKARLVLYRRLSSVRSEEEVAEAQQELIDRYGPLPKEAKELICVLQLKVLMRRMGLKSLTLGPKGMSLTPGKDPVLEPGLILLLVQSKPNEYAILPEGKFVIKGSFQSAAQLYDRLRQVLQSNMQ